MEASLKRILNLTWENVRGRKTFVTLAVQTGFTGDYLSRWHHP